MLTRSTALGEPLIRSDSRRPRRRSAMPVEGTRIATKWKAATASGLSVWKERMGVDKATQTGGVKPARTRRKFGRATLQRDGETDEDHRHQDGSRCLPRSGDADQDRY